jgi:hypothetical protein
MEVNAMSGALELKLEDLKAWLERETTSIIQPLKNEGKKLTATLKSRLEDFESVCESFLESSEKEMLKSSPKTYRRAKAAYKLAQKTLEIMDKISVPEEISFESVQKLCEDLERVLALVGQERWKWFRIIEPYFILDRRKFDITLKRAADSYGELRNFLTHKYAKVKDAEATFSSVDKLKQTLDESKELDKSKEQMKSRSFSLEKEIEDTQRKISSLQSKGEARELVQVNQRIEELDAKVKHGLRHLQKPLIKLRSLAQSGQIAIPLEEAKKLDEYLSKPFTAFATEDDGYPLLKSILRKLDEVSSQGKLKLKMSRLRKAQEQIDATLHKDILISLQQSCKEAFSHRQQLLASEAIATFQKETEQVQENLREMQKQKSLADSRNAFFETEQKKTLEKIDNQKTELEKLILKLSNKNVHIILK